MPPTASSGVSQKRVYAVTPPCGFSSSTVPMEPPSEAGFSPDFPISAYNQTTDRIFQATERGLIQCLAERDNVTPYFHETPAPATDQEAAPPDEEATDEGKNSPAPPAANPPDDTEEPEAKNPPRNRRRNDRRGVKGEF